MTTRRVSVSDVEHLKVFHCLQVTIEFAQNLITTDRQGVVCKVTLINADNSVEASCRSDVVTDDGPSPVFDSRMLIPYAAQRRLQFSVWGVSEEESEIGQYTLDLSPFTESKKSLAAKMKLKDSTQKEAGHLNVRIKMSAQAIERPSVSKYVSSKRQEEIKSDEIDGVQVVPSDVRERLQWKSLYVLVIDAEDLPSVEKLTKLDPFVRVVLGRQTLKSEVQSNVGTSSPFNTLFSFPYNGERYLRLEAWDSEAVRSDRELSSKQIDLLQLVSSRNLAAPQDAVVSLETHDRLPGGTLRIRYGFSQDRLLSCLIEEHSQLKDFPLAGPPAFNPPADAGLFGSDQSTEHYRMIHPDDDSDDNSNNEQWNEEVYRTGRLAVEQSHPTIRVHVFQAEGLPDVERIGRIDPYVGVTVGQQTVKTPVLRNAGEDPHWEIAMDFQHQRERYVIFEVYDSQAAGKDRLLGRRAFDLTAFFSRKANVLEASVSLFPAGGEAVPRSTRNGRLYFRIEKRVIAVSEAAIFTPEDFE